MPAYKTKQVDEQGKPVYQDVAYPVTKEFREKLYGQIIEEWDKAKEPSQHQAQGKEVQTEQDKAFAQQGEGRMQREESTPFR